MTAWHSYRQQPRQNLTLELVCTVTAFPAAKVAWGREAGGEVAVERYRVELHEDQEDQDTVRHLLLIDNPSQEVRPGLTAGESETIFSLPQDLQGSFVCSARNSLGLTRKRISIAGRN